MTFYDNNEKFHHVSYEGHDRTTDKNVFLYFFKWMFIFSTNPLNNFKNPLSFFYYPLKY